jgi:hypothetical protein
MGVTRTLRVDEELDEAVVKRASQERISVNFLVNRCIRRFVEWDSVAKGFGMVATPKMVLDRLAIGKDGDEFESLGRAVAKELVKPSAEFINGEFTVASCVDVFRRSSTYGGGFSFEFGEGRDSRSHVIALRHDQGQLWSRYYAGILDELFRVLLGEEAKVSYTDALCILQMKAR